VGLALGVGVGLGEPPAVFVPPPQPIELKMKTTRTKKRLACMVVYFLLRTVTPHSGDFRYRIPNSALIVLPSLHHFDIYVSRDKCLRAYRSIMDHGMYGPVPFSDSAET
jgi:hypothetical protein